ncbi:uncharacterized protein BX663DRAFT_466708 [Cokeromyces recurvatus]|uniref:uncharacterized protein n=1 Tax=Cokeromyces recurvatus TaxID=90255 RepID=UPI002220513E|nr:uncharacterized protein BX663DRAFT_466708 [Cokeromyces recurvatus]KAI7906635.1 hypothetical protein BX663DRAFT_466708 [Cokeromyces recurvatus]
MDSPNNSPLRATEERASCIHTIIYIIYQLFFFFFFFFLANNDVVALDWIENEYCQTGRCRWDGDVMKVNSKKISTVFIKFSGGTKCLCLIDLDNCIYFEELFVFKQNYFRKIHVSFHCPSMPRLLIKHIKQISKMLQWKEAVINQTLQFQD